MFPRSDDVERHGRGKLTRSGDTDVGGGDDSGEATSSWARYLAMSVDVEVESCESSSGVAMSGDTEMEGGGDSVRPSVAQPKIHRPLTSPRDPRP